MVGGTTGSHVNPAAHPTVVGGRMWDNRSTIAVRGASASRPEHSFFNSTSAYAPYKGRDAVYVTAHPDLSGRLVRYVISDSADPDQGTWELVGVQASSYTGKGAGAVDTRRNLSVRSVGPSTSTGFLAWSLDTAGPTNTNARLRTVDLSSEFPAAGLQSCGMDFDGVRSAFAIWCTGRDVWYLTPPDVIAATGWRLERAAVAAGAGEPPSRELGSTFPGVLGKWKLARRFDDFLRVFVGDSGNVYACNPPPGWNPQDQISVAGPTNTRCGYVWQTSTNHHANVPRVTQSRRTRMPSVPAHAVARKGRSAVHVRRAPPSFD